MENSNNSCDEWAERSEYWSIKSREIPFNHRNNKRRDRRPLVICGHGASLKVDRGTLFVKNGFTHYPHKQEEYRYFRGDPHLPTRIVIIDASGSISFGVLAWLGEQKIPLIQINWKGEIVSLGNSSYSADPKMVLSQRNSLENGNSEKEFQKLLIQKFKNSISTLKVLPDNPNKIAAIEYLNMQIAKLSAIKTISNEKILGIEGEAAAQYFSAWRGTSLKWKLRKRDLIPRDWLFIGSRRSALGKTSRYASHPVNAMLNYAYGVLHSQVKMQIIAEGCDPTIGVSHWQSKYRDALVLDRMEPLRPIVDRAVLELVLKETLTPEDFVITNEGYCRLNLQLARKLVQSVASIKISPGLT